MAKAKASIEKLVRANPMGRKATPEEKAALKANRARLQDAKKALGIAGRHRLTDEDRQRLDEYLARH